METWSTIAKGTREEVMRSLSLSWSINRDGQRQGGISENPKWPDIEQSLESIKKFSGVVSLVSAQTLSGNLCELQVRCEHGKYLVTLGEQFDDDYRVLSLNNKDAIPGEVEILGDMWDTKQVTSDFSTVSDLFREFYETGAVSTNLSL
jgi:hypothetical protein